MCQEYLEHRYQQLPPLILKINSKISNIQATLSTHATEPFANEQNVQLERNVKSSEIVVSIVSSSMIVSRMSHQQLRVLIHVTGNLVAHSKCASPVGMNTVHKSLVQSIDVSDEQSK